MSTLSKFLRRTFSFRRFKEWKALTTLSTVGLVVVILIILLLLVYSPLYFPQLRYEINKPVDRAVIAPFTIHIIDKEATEREQRDAESTYFRYYDYDSGVEEEIVRDLRQALRLAREAKQKEEALAWFEQQIVETLGLRLATHTLKLLLERAPHKTFQNNLTSIVHHILAERGVIEDKYAYAGFEQENLVKLNYRKRQTDRELTAEQMLNYPEEMRRYLKEVMLPRFFDSKTEREPVAELLTNLLRPNITFQQQRTFEARQRVIDSLEPVMLRFNKGETIIAEGELVTAQHYATLKRLQEKVKQYNLYLLLAEAFYILAIFTLLYFFIHRFFPQYSFSPRGVVLIALPVLMTLFVGRLFLIYLPSRELAEFAFPAGLISMLGIILLNPTLALVSLIAGVLLFAVAVEFSLHFMVVAFFGGFTALLSLYAIKERKEVLMAGFKTALVNFIIIILLKFLEDPSQFNPVFSLWGVMNGVLCGFLTISTLPLFEFLFGITTDVRLLELTGIQHPLLRRLEEKTPGTYQHSLNVAKLAEPAAMAIGANYLLVRGGAYFHDVGKIVKPKYYSENQITAEDKSVYAKLSPHMATLIIKNHIKEGMELARRYRVPPAVVDFIPQHHGTSLIKFFYQKALESANGEEKITPEDFRYPGPKPQTKEAAIVMLADAVEATITSRLATNRVTESEIRRLVHQTITEKFNDGQFDECDLTLRDLYLISNSFVKTLLSRFHFRVTYPGVTTKETPAREPHPSTSAKK